ncbi:MAG: CBS domain-containing protein [Eubacteriales bacterium]
MDIITTHTNTDLDALASMVAAQKLYPGSVMVFPGKLSRNVEEFMALHKDTLNVRAVRDIEPDLVETVILVDTKSPGRLAKLAELLERPGVEVHIYDHHPRSDGDAKGKTEVVEAVGATTTLLVEKIKAKNIPLTTMEATILSLGIYEDTGSLVFSSTTARDASAVAYLLEKGANLAVVADFLGRPLTEDQRQLLKVLLVSAERYQINGVKIMIARGTIDEFVGGLALLTHKLADFSHLDAVFTVVEMEDRVHVVARSSVPEVNVRDILSDLGGGGHAAAASATVKKVKVAEVAEILLASIRSRVRPPVTAAEIMSSPVKTVTPETLIEDAGSVMLRYGHTGLPVIKDGRVAGVISRRDVEKATHHGLGHAPVKGFMTSVPITVTPDTPASAVRELMIENDVGRLPVIKDGKLVGIVSRTDVLRTLHGEVEKRHRTVYINDNHEISFRNVKELMYRGISGEYLEIMEKAGELAAGFGYKVYMAGGIVRDLLLGMECTDVDLVVEGDGIALAQELAARYACRVRAHRKFGTATVLFAGGQQVDIATARVEFYQYPAAMPQVETSTLHQDLYRRDFTINAMAVSLNKESFGDVVDFFGGREDLYRGQIRVLHNLSFVEDPTRILRAVRFEKRYQMSLEPQTLKLIKEAARNKMLARVSAERVWEELRYIMLESRPGHALARLMELQLWDFLFPGVEHFNIRQVLAELPRSIKTLRSWDLAEPGEPWMIYLIGVLHRTGADLARQICERYHLNKRQTEKVQAALSGCRALCDGLRDQDEISVSDLAGQVMGVPREGYPLVLTYLGDAGSRRRFRQVLTAMSYDRPGITGKDLREIGLKPGPVFKLVLDALWRARLDGKVRTREEELAFVREYVGSSEGAKNNV